MERYERILAAIAFGVLAVLLLMFVCLAAADRNPTYSIGIQERNCIECYEEMRATEAPRHTMIGGEVYSVRVDSHGVFHLAYVPCPIQYPGRTVTSCSAAIIQVPQQ